jgi:chitin synthase
MAYQQHSPYHHDQNNYHGGPGYPPQQSIAPGQVFNPQEYIAQPHQDYYAEQEPWDSKSTQSYRSEFADSQVHLNPHQQYEMAQVNHAPMPTMPYQQYPPQQQQLLSPAHRPGMMRGASSGWSDARDKLMKRRSVRQVELQQGNLVLDMPVPSHIIPAGKGSEEEMSKLRYTAATCDPDDFMRSRYSLRPYLYGRHTELFIVMTMYNEDEVLFTKTMNA